MPPQFIRWRDNKAGVFVNDHGQGSLARCHAGLARIAECRSHARAFRRRTNRPPRRRPEATAHRRPTHRREMNLAVRDIRHNVGRFALTTVGIGLLLMIVMGMGGIYRGLIYEATLLVDQVGADLWVVQGSTRGPFAEVSRIPANLEDRVRAVPGVASARRFVSHTIQREHRGQPLRMVVQGLSWPEDKGDWVAADCRTRVAPGALRNDCGPLARFAARREAQAGQGRLRSRRFDEGNGGDRRRRVVLLHGERRGGHPIRHARRSHAARTRRAPCAAWRIWTWVA